MSNWSTDFEVGLVDDFDFTVERSYFATDQKYNNGNSTLLQWEGRTDNLDLPETHVWFTVGKGWFSSDGGKTVQHESGKPFGLKGEGRKYYNGSSKIAKLIRRCVEDFGIGDELAKRGDPNVAAVWEGFVFHMQYEQIDFGSGIDAKPSLFPSRFVGVAGARTVQVAQTNGNGNAAAKARVVALAKATDSYETFQVQAVEIPGVLEDDELLNSVLNPTGIYAQARA